MNVAFDSIVMYQDKEKNTVYVFILNQITLLEALSLKLNRKLLDATHDLDV